MQKQRRHMIDYERLGAFYLGKSYDLHAGEIADELILYDSKDLSTHAVIVGMTGSGKTGLGVSLIEEAAIDGIPSIVIDPKGDMGNLLLTFPGLTAGEFRPWVDPEEAARQGMSCDEFAAERAELWRDGLAEWQQGPERVQRLRDAAEFAIYTPGSDAGLPIAVLKALSAPPSELHADSDALRERIGATVAGLLTLLGIDPDPLRSREHILVSNILDHAWREGRNLSIAQLIREIQTPPFSRLGVMDLETIFPEKDRLAMAMTVNNVLASPTFAAWMSGEPLSIPDLLYTAEGKPRVSVISIAHLTDTERMFFLTILLNEVLAWMRSQPGTSSLRALLYMDEVFGYLPPVANPPTKQPLLALLKQARAFGLGLVLATQNPADLDYKALSNAGTWFLGRLQTERDKLRVLDGLEGASVGAGMNFDRRKIESILASVGSRVFLMNNVHEDEPAIFRTRWALSYLRGPLTRDQIRTLMAPQRQQTSAVEADGRPAGPAAQLDIVSAAEEADLSEHPPVLSKTISQAYAVVNPSIPREVRIIYRPAVLSLGRVHFCDRTAEIDTWRDVVRVCQIDEDVPRYVWESCDVWDEVGLSLDDEAVADARFSDLPTELAKSKNYTTWKSQLKNRLYRSDQLTISYCPSLGIYALAEESRGAFRARLQHQAHERRDVEVEKLRERYASRFETMQERLRKAEQRVEVQKEQAQAAATSAAVSLGQTILGALFGRKLRSSTSVTKAGTAMRSASRASQQRGDVTRAEEDVLSLQEELEELQAELETQIDELTASLDVDALEIEPYEIKPRKSDISVDTCGLLWLPWSKDAKGQLSPAWQDGDV